MRTDNGSSDENLLMIVNDSILNLALKYVLHESEVIPKLATTAPFVKCRMTRTNLKVDASGEMLIEAEVERDFKRTSQINSTHLM